MTALTLERLASTSTLKDVMIPRLKLVCGKTLEECELLLIEHPDYNIIPIIQEDKITGYLERNLGKGMLDLHRDVISDSTSLLELIDALDSRSFCFVLVGTQVNGYVHFSDLNNRLVELSLYVLLQAVEHLMVKQIVTLLDGELRSALGEPRATLLEGTLKRLSKKNSELDLLSLMQLSDYLKIAKHRKLISIDEDQLRRLYEVRNSVSHAQEPLVEDHADVSALVWVKNYCISLLEADAEFR